MANDFSVNPWRLDTASTTAVVVTLPFRVQSLHWSGATANDVLILKNKNGKTVFEGTATAADMFWGQLGPHGGQQWDGLIAYQIPHGVVQITY